MLQPEPTPSEPWSLAVERDLEELSRKKERWLRLPIARKIDLASTKRALGISLVSVSASPNG